MKQLVLKLVCLVLLVTISNMAWSTPVFAACANDGSSKSQVLIGVGESGGNCSSTGVTGLVSTVVTVLSYLAGVIAIIMIIWAGFRYISSGGDAQKVGGAKNALIYALVGVAVAALAQVLVHFVLYQTSEAVNP